MKEILDLIKQELPRFFLTLIRIISNPRTHLAELAKAPRSKEEAALTKAIIYFTLCGLVSQVWLAPIYGSERIWGKLAFLGYSLFIPFVFYALASLALKLSWGMVKYKLPYLDYFKVFAYQMGTLLNGYLFLNFINISVLKYFSLEKFQQVVDYNYLKKSAIDPNTDMLENIPYLIYVITGFAFLLIVIWWFYYSWRVYREMNKAEKRSSVLAAVIFTIFMVAVFFIDMVISNALLSS